MVNIYCCCRPLCTAPGSDSVRVPWEVTVLPFLSPSLLSFSCKSKISLWSGNKLFSNSLGRAGMLKRHLEVCFQASWKLSLGEQVLTSLCSLAQGMCLPHLTCVGSPLAGPGRTQGGGERGSLCALPCAVPFSTVPKINLLCTVQNQGRVKWQDKRKAVLWILSFLPLLSALKVLHFDK